MEGAGRLAPSSKLAVYLATLFLAYSCTALSGVAAVLAVVIVFAIALPRDAGRRLWQIYAGKLSTFVLSIFVLRVALEWAGNGSAVHAPLAARDGLLYPAARDAARVAVLVLGAAIVHVSTKPRDVVHELEQTTMPRAGRLLVMMIVQYPRILTRRYEQILEAQVARGADRPVRIRQRITFGLALILPLLQSELNAVGDRAALIHTRRLDVETSAGGTWRATRARGDVAALGLATATLAFGLAVRFGWR